MTKSEGFTALNHFLRLKDDWMQARQRLIEAEAKVADAQMILVKMIDQYLPAQEERKGPVDEHGAFTS